MNRHKRLESLQVPRRLGFHHARARSLASASHYYGFCGRTPLSWFSKEPSWRDEDSKILDLLEERNHLNKFSFRNAYKVKSLKACLQKPKRIFLCHVTTSTGFSKTLHTALKCLVWGRRHLLTPKLPQPSIAMIIYDPSTGSFPWQKKWQNHKHLFQQLFQQPLKQKTKKWQLQKTSAATPPSDEDFSHQKTRRLHNNLRLSFRCLEGHLQCWEAHEAGRREEIVRGGCWRLGWLVCNTPKQWKTWVEGPRNAFKSLMTSLKSI